VHIKSLAEDSLPTESSPSVFAHAHTQPFSQAWAQLRVGSSNYNPTCNFSTVTLTRGAKGRWEAGGRGGWLAVGTSGWEERTSSWWSLCLFHKTLPFCRVPRQASLHLLTLWEAPLGAWAPQGGAGEDSRLWS
jgi:hypothetical protein